MKLLQIINSYDLKDGGAQRLSLQFHQTYLAQGLNSHLLSLIRSSANGVPNVYSLGCASPYRMATFLRLYAFLKQPRWRDLDIIHVHLFPAQGLVALVVKLLGLKARLITTEHNTFNRRRRLLFGRQIDRALYRAYDRIVCISPGTAAAMVEWLPEFAAQVITIYNGIDLEEYRVTERDCTERDTRIIISAGRLTEQKNYETAIDAIGRIDGRALEYWILGQGEREATLKARVQALHLEDRVKFCGFRADVSLALRRADIFLLTSYWEGFGLAVVEAMAVGLPVVVSDVPGLREVVTPESQAGFLIDPTDDEAFAEHLVTLLDDPALRQRMGNNARQQAARFDIKNTIAAYLDLYSVVLRERVYRDSENE